MTPTRYFTISGHSTRQDYLLDDMHNKIIEDLRQIEKLYNVDIVYAVESGSRAWGYPSKTSDHDVRFIFIRRPEAYIKLVPDSDTITYNFKHMESPLIEMHGWDLRKACLLGYKTNVSLLNWINSATVYIDKWDFRAGFAPLVLDRVRLKAVFYHHLSQARSIYSSSIKGKDEVQVKKYLYVLRGLLSCEYILDNNSIPLIAVQDLLGADKHAIGPHLDYLVNLRKSSYESRTIPPRPQLDVLIKRRLSHFDVVGKFVPEDAVSSTPNALDCFCISTIISRSVIPSYSASSDT